MFSQELLDNIPEIRELKEIFKSEILLICSVHKVPVLREFTRSDSLRTQKMFEPAENKFRRVFSPWRNNEEGNQSDVDDTACYELNVFEGNGGIHSVWRTGLNNRIPLMWYLSNDARIKCKICYYV